MFFHTMKYTLLNLLRDKGQVFWCVAFPLLLGTMFHFAFAFQFPIEYSHCGYNFLPVRRLQLK